MKLIKQINGLLLMSTSKPIIKNIMLVDDHQLFSEGLCSLLNHHFLHYKVQLFSTLSSAKNNIEILQPILILLDLNLHNEKGMTLLTQFKQYDFPPPCLVISSEIDCYVIKHCLDIGAAGFVHKSIGSEKLIEAINSVIDTGFYLAESIQQQLEQLTGSIPKVFNTSQLTQKENKILHYLKQGYSNKEIAENICISPHTVKYHLANIFEKMQVKNRAECVSVSTNQAISERQLVLID